MGAAFSSDGQWIAYGIKRKEDYGAEIQLAKFDGSATRQLTVAGTREELHVERWSLDDTELFVIAVTWPPEGTTCRIDRERATDGTSDEKASSRFLLPWWVMPVLAG